MSLTLLVLGIALATIAIANAVVFANHDSLAQEHRRVTASELFPVTPARYFDDSLYTPTGNQHRIRALRAAGWMIASGVPGVLLILKGIAG